MASVSSNVTAQAESENSEAYWRKEIEDTTREAQVKLKDIEEQWKEAVKHTVAEDMHADMLKLRGEGVLHEAFTLL